MGKLCHLWPSIHRGPGMSKFRHLLSSIQRGLCKGKFRHRSGGDWVWVSFVICCRQSAKVGYWQPSPSVVVDLRGGDEGEGMGKLCHLLLSI